MSQITSLGDEALIAFDHFAGAASRLMSPTLRLGVTGLSRSGKTVFITSLIHNLVHGGRLPLFKAHSGGRIAGAQLRPQPSMDVPRFAYEEHISTLLEDKAWPQSTRNISQLRLAIKYDSASTWNRTFGSGVLHIDIVDYPGEWLLDLPLLALTYEAWSKQAWSLSNLPGRKPLAAGWHRAAKDINPQGPLDELVAVKLAKHFTGYLKKCREDKNALSTLPPGRFLMPGELEGSPVLTFAPLDIDLDAKPAPDSLHALMRERYEAYKRVVIKPFFREHFARLDRQIVLVDALQALNAGPDALHDLETALSGILECFRPGNGSWLGAILSRRIDRILFAATKADHLHHDSHDRLENLLARLVDNAVKRARFAGASVNVTALSAVRATREAWLETGGEKLPVITGIPMAGETIGGEVFDGKTETAIFPGDLPARADALFTKAGFAKAGGRAQIPPPELKFVRFRPPDMEKTDDGLELSLPHIRLDRALEFLFGDRLV